MWHNTNTLFSVTSGSLLNFFSNVPYGAHLKTKIETAFLPLTKIYNINEKRCFDLPKILICTVFSPILSNIVPAIVSKKISGFSTFAFIFEFISVLYS